VHFAFVYATKQPMIATFVPLRLTPQSMPCLSACDALSVHDLEYGHYEHEFSFTAGEYIHDASMRINSDIDITVIPNLVFLEGGKVVSDSAAVAIADYLEGLPSLAARAVRKRASPLLADPTLLEAHPWLAEFMGKNEKDPANPNKRKVTGDGDPSASGSGAADSGEADDPAELPPEEIEALCAKFDEERLAWGEGEGLPGEDFNTVLRGGKWTAARKLLSSDSIRGQTVGSGSKVFCNLYGIQNTITLSFAHYGNDIASTLALGWAHRCHFFYALYASSAVTPFVFTDEHIASYEESEGFVDMIIAASLEHPMWGRVEFIRCIPNLREPLI
jgi:hypothetical protein